MLLNILIILYKIIMYAIRIYSMVWGIWIILSWLNAFGIVQTNYYNPIIRFIENITDGVINKVFGDFRYKFVIGNLDLSPFIFLILLTYVLPFLLSKLFSILIRILS